MAQPSNKPLAEGRARRVLVVVEDATLAELLDEALADAGHARAHADGAAAARAALARDSFDAAIVDLDTRARDGADVVRLIRERSPATTVIALLPCGGMPAAARVDYHVATEKPARLAPLLAAVRAARARVSDGE